MNLLSIGKRNHKLKKSDNMNVGYLSSIMYLAPHKLSGVNLCPKASKGCATSCLFTSGHAVIYPKVNKTRLERAKLFNTDKQGFKNKLFAELTKFNTYCKKYGQKAAIRLNGTSDIRWEKVFPDIFSVFNDIQFYDYTKIVSRFDNPLPPNYNLTFSRSENNETDCLKVLDLGYNVAVVFNKELPKKYLNRKVIDGDKHDLRFIEKGGIVIGLRAKGKARKDDTGFVVK